jgi:DNA-binding transcriptional LysR family regulator
MYNHYLDIFIKVADSGSFSKAGELLFISPNAVMKQINNLEEHLGVTLFERTSHGVKLTESGKIIYAESKKMIAHSNAVIKKVKEIESGSSNTIRVGSSIMRPAKKAIEVWRKIRPLYPELKLEIIQFSDSFETYPKIRKQLGEKIDIICTNIIKDQNPNEYNRLAVETNKISIAVPPTSPLASKDIIEVEDLHGQKLYILERGLSSNIDKVRDYLIDNHPQIKLIDLPHYDLEVLSRYEKIGATILTYTFWEDVHPSLIIKPVNWQFETDYGFIYSKNPSPAVLYFIEAVKSLQK